MVKTEDLSGQIFGNLKVVRQADDKVRKNGKKEAMWLCECQCEEHTSRIVRGTDLKNGHTKSCGCEKVRAFIERNRKENLYCKRGKYIYVELTNTNDKMICDAGDWEKYRDRCWSVDTTGYARASKRNKNIYFHRLVMPQYSKDCFIDHINGNKLDNRKENLRYVTPRQSMMNIHSDRSNTKCKGVYYNANSRKYEAYIHNNGKIYLGMYNTLEEAREVREKTELKLFGEYSEIISRTDKG